MKTLPLLMTAIACLSAQSALGHADLEETVPANGATIASAPENVQLEFSEPVRLTALSIQRDQAPKRSLGPLPSDTTERFSVELPTLEDGHYVIGWRALSGDAHIMSGEFMFAVGAGNHAGHTNAVAEPAAGHSDHSE